MITEMEKRSYSKKKRAEGQQQTRARIVDATIALHQELGPRHTTISAVAERAGVQRLTVYRYFPDETALFQACTAGWIGAHPPPPLPLAQQPSGATDGLCALYAYYRETERMWVVSHRDVELVPALQAPMQAMAGYLAGYAAGLLPAWPEPDSTGARRVVATLAVQFASWRTLAIAGMSDREMALLMTRLIAAAGADRSVV